MSYEKKYRFLEANNFSKLLHFINGFVRNVYRRKWLRMKPGVLEALFCSRSLFLFLEHKLDQIFSLFWDLFPDFIC